MTLKASTIETLLRDSGTGEVFIEAEPGEITFDTGQSSLEDLARAHGYRYGGTEMREGRSGHVFHVIPEKN